MRTESLEDSHLTLPDGAGPHPGVVVIPPHSRDRRNGGWRVKASSRRSPSSKKPILWVKVSPCREGECSGDNDG
jgi:hypothetical protein